MKKINIVIKSDTIGEICHFTLAAMGCEVCALCAGENANKMNWNISYYYHIKPAN